MAVYGHWPQPRRVDEALDSDIVKAYALNWPAEVWARHGAQHPLGEDFTGTQDSFRRPSTNTPCCPTLAQSRRHWSGGHLTGTPDEVIDQAAEWRDHGLRYAVIADASSIQPSLRRGLAASVPFARILRGLRKL